GIQRARKPATEAGTLPTERRRLICNRPSGNAYRSLDWPRPAERDGCKRKTGPAGPNADRQRLEGDSRSLPVVCSCDAHLTSAGPEPAEEAFADHAWHRAAAWINRPNIELLSLYPEGDVAQKI